MMCRFENYFSRVSRYGVNVRNCVVLIELCHYVVALLTFSPSGRLVVKSTNGKSKSESSTPKSKPESQTVESDSESES
jgi:hypothetical protein